MSDRAAPSPLDDLAPWQRKLHDVMFEADTVVGKVFDVILILAILASVFVVMMETVVETDSWRNRLWLAEWLFTILFTVEYVLRLLCVRKPLRYAVSFFGMVDLLSIVPTYASLFLPYSHSQSLLVIRALRLLRIFRVFKLARFLSEAASMRQAIWSARAKITVFMCVVIITVTIVGTAMYLVEGTGNGANPAFDSIPQCMYWAIITMSTVGYGDAVPQTPPGKMLASILVLIGYSMIIIPTGIVSAEMMSARVRPVTTQACPTCMREGHETDAKFCKHCGSAM